MLSELFEIKPVQTPNESVKLSFEEENQLINLGKFLERKSLVSYNYRGNVVTIRGIPEDFKILINRELVCDICYDVCYNVCVKLARYLLN